MPIRLVQVNLLTQSPKKIIVSCTIWFKIIHQSLHNLTSFVKVIRNAYGTTVKEEEGPANAYQVLRAILKIFSHLRKKITNSSKID